MLDFTILANYENPVAIHCRTQSEAEELLAEMFLQHPGLTEAWDEGDTHWRFYEDGTCYAPHIYDKRGRFLEYSPVSYWESVGYEIVPFEALTRVVDLGEFEPGGVVELAALGII